MVDMKVAHDLDGSLDIAIVALVQSMLNNVHALEVGCTTKFGASAVGGQL